MASAVGTILVLAAALMVVPAIVPFVSRAAVDQVPAFLLPAACLFVFGAALRLVAGRPPDVSLTVLEGGVIVVVSWLVVMVVSAWPFAVLEGLPFRLALFESVSGWTTTGLTVVDVVQADRAILLWRSLTQFAGGAGFAILMVSAVVGPTGVGIPSAEGRSEQLVPQVRRSSRLVLGIYSGYAVAGTLGYLAAGVPAFDALNHALTAVSTGGFSTQAESIGHWDSLAVEGVSLVLMLCGSMSFLTAWALLRGQFRAAVRSSELRLAAVVLPIAVVTVTAFTTGALYPRFAESARVVLFETVSAFTTTGFTIVEYGAWNGFGLGVLVILMAIGGGTCSTAGGIKRFRIALLLDLIAWEVRRALLPRGAILERPVWEGARRVFVDDARIRQVVAFVTLYLGAYLVGVLVLAANGYSLQDSVFEFGSAIGTVGLSVGVTSPTMPGPVLWTAMAAMFLGRLEFMIVVVSIVKVVKDMRLMVRRQRI